MKKCLLVLSVLLTAFTSGGPAPANRLGVAGPLTFDKTVFNLAWSGKPSATYYVQEYLPSGEKLASFQRMLALHLFDKDADVKDVVNLKINELEARKQTDAICHYEVTASPDEKEIIVDFLLSQNIGYSQAIAEFNVYRYKKVDLGAGKPGVLLYAYSKRSYGAAINDFLKTLAPVRTAAIAAMITTKVPAVKIADSK